MELDQYMQSAKCIQIVDYIVVVFCLVTAADDVVILVSSWDCGQSVLDREHAADKARELKRRMSEMYDDDIDRGRVSD